MSDKNELDRRIAAIREEYARESLEEKDVAEDPIVQLRYWMNEAVEAEVWEPNAMTLATAGADGKPTARIVLMRQLTEKGPVFFTNYQSRKGREIAENPYAGANLFWPELQRQVSLAGKVERISAEASDAYFKSRPVKSRIGAWASEQSRVISSRETLERSFKDLESRFGDEEVERPEHWGGYCIILDRAEFWQGRPDRMHDRIELIHEGEGWKKRRLSP